MPGTLNVYRVFSYNFRQYRLILECGLVTPFVWMNRNSSGWKTAVHRSSLLPTSIKVAGTIQKWVGKEVDGSCKTQRRTRKFSSLSNVGVYLALEQQYSCYNRSV